MPIRPAIDTLREMREGRFLEELDSEFNDLVRQVRHTNKAGKLTIEIDVKPVNGDATSVTLADKITVKAPRIRQATLFFTTPDANLSRRDPRQPDLPNLTDASHRDEDTKDYTTAPDQENETA